MRKMVSSIQTSLSALHGFEKKLSATADNTANVNTHGYKKERVILAEGSHGGVTPCIQRIDSPGIPVEIVKDDQWVQTETSNVDLSEEAGESIVSQKGYLANLKMVRAQDELLGNLLDIIG
jgi:flagellar hook protein FlgE